ncbi:MAG: DEAD/DEAH box helicase [Ancrocorticia sp.]
MESEQLFHPRLIINEADNTMLRAIRDELRRSEHFDFSVAFVGTGALGLLKQALYDFKGTGRIITGSYLDFNSPDVFRELLGLENIEVLVHPEDEGGFHAKGYVFRQSESTTAIIGSSNLTRNALLLNKEWNLRFSALPGGDVTRQLASAIDTQATLAIPLTEEWIEEYEKRYVRRAQIRQTVADATKDIEPRDARPIIPNAMQREALEALDQVRRNGERRAIVISATGTGKTILSALDVREVQPKHMLFLVHREQILDKAMGEFRKVLGGPRSDYGKFVGGQRQLDRKYVFATVQSLSMDRGLMELVQHEFDYVLIDEVHRAGAESYRRLLERLTPEFLLGMTATPERTDEFSIFELFDYNVAYEIRLQKALESNMLVPFNYYGITDYVDAGGNVIDDMSDLRHLVAPERVRYLIEMITRYGFPSNVHGLMFCSRRDEAQELSGLLNLQMVNGRRLRTAVLSGEDSMVIREETVRQLERGELDYILTVDIFNEGIDIPCVNQVVMLRRTKSSIVFTQQLGRGLRKAPGKDHLRVLDFVGNYDSNYLIPIALTGDSSLNKDVIRKKIIQSDSSGAIAGVSSINFDEISRKRILESLAKVKLDSIANLKRAFLDLTQRLGRNPRLLDFARFETADPVVVATKKKNYWELMKGFKAVDIGPSSRQASYLSFLSLELLNGKRPHELVLLRELLAGNSLSQVEFSLLLQNQGLINSRATTDSVARVLSLDFFNGSEKKPYGDAALVRLTSNGYVLDDDFADEYGNNDEFHRQVDDIISAGLFTARHKYQWGSELQIGERYSRKDVCRILNWTSNQQSTMYGYKVDRLSGSCPIFVTYHKDDDVAASTKYEDEFLDPSTLRWFTRSKRTLQSAEVRAIVDHEVPLYVFAKKDDAEGTDFYYLGTATPREAKQEVMQGDEGKSLDVVTMKLDLEKPLNPSLYEYFVNA